MRSVIFGNGLNIKFGGRRYSNGEIIRRGIETFRKDKKIYEIAPPEILNLFEEMYKTVPNIIEGLYDVASNDCSKELKHFKKSYTGQKIDSIGKIGMEDYLLVLHLMYKWNREHNDSVTFSVKQEEEASEIFKDLCLAGIYDNNRINSLHEKYSEKFISYVNEFDNVFTTNYDSNLDKIYHGKVQHIHGQFDILDQRYDPNSFRNSLSDNQFEGNHLVNLPGYEYLHSTALMNYSGVNKYKKIMAQYNLNRISLDSMKEMFNENINAKGLTLAIEARKKMDKNPNLRFQEYTGYNEFNKITGNLEIMGLSPLNDNHIFKKTADLSNTFYFYSDEDERLAKKVMPNDTIFRDMTDFWKKMNC